MSLIQSQSLLSHEFNSLTEENKKLRQQIIEITLGQESLIEQNKKLQQQITNKDKLIIQTRLKQQNLQHSLKQLNKLYDSLQSQHKQLYTFTKCQHPFQLRNVYKKQAQLALDLAFIERQSYRQTKKTKNQQLNLYQQRIIQLLKENDNMKKQILQMTSSYNQKIFQLKKTNYETQYKLKSIQNLQHKLKNIQEDNLQLSKHKPIQNNFKNLQVELKLENTKEKLQFYIQQNVELRGRNLSLVEENNKLLEEIKQRGKQLQKLKQQNIPDLSKHLQGQNTSIQYIQSMMEENLRMRKEIEEITQKYVLLAETYPRLVQDFESIRELQQNVNKLNTVKQLEDQLSQAQLRQSSLQQSLTSLEKKYLQQLKARESIEYKASILTKRFNEIFIKMNPYFNIYQYQSLEFKQEEYKFFDENKNYKQLKEYEKEIYQLRRQVKQQQHNNQTKEKELTDKLSQRQRQVNKCKQQLREYQQQVQQMTTGNKLLTQKVKNYQLLNIDEKVINQKVNQNRINSQVSLPLLETMVERLQLERQQLLKAIYIKDNKIVELVQQLRQATYSQKIQCIPINQNIKNNQLFNQKQSNNQLLNEQKNKNLIHNQISELLKANQALQKKYEQSVRQLSSLIQKLQTQLNNQHDIYQMEIKKYQHQYKTQFIQLTKTIQKWINISDNFKSIITQKQHQLEKHKEHQQKSNQQININNQQQQNTQMQQQPQPFSSQIQQNILLTHPSHTHLDKVNNILSEQGNNKLIGQSTVQNLTTTLKKYQQEMNQLLSMCAKLTQQYTQLKKQLTNQHQLQSINNNLTLTNNNLQQQITQLQSIIQQKNLSILNLQNLYKNKQTQCQQLKSQLNQQTQLISFNLQNQKKNNSLLNQELTQIKDKLLQITNKQSTQHINQHTLMNKSQFQTIVVMHANKNKEISHLIQKNKSLENKIQTLINQLNSQQTQINTKKSLEITPLQQAQFKQLTQLLQQTDLVDLVKKANEIIQKQKQHEEQQKLKNHQEQQKQKQISPENKDKMVNEEQEKEKSLEY